MRVCLNCNRGQIQAILCDDYQQKSKLILHHGDKLGAVVSPPPSVVVYSGKFQGRTTNKLLPGVHLAQLEDSLHASWSLPLMFTSCDPPPSRQSFTHSYPLNCFLPHCTHRQTARSTATKNARNAVGAQAKFSNSDTQRTRLISKIPTGAGSDEAAWESAVGASVVAAAPLWVRVPSRPVAPVEGLVLYFALPCLADARFPSC